MNIPSLRQYKNKTECVCGVFFFWGGGRGRGEEMTTKIILMC